MGTRSDIIVHLTDGRWKRIYCHWDGYLSHNGKILFEHYGEQKKAEKLVALGDMSSLAPKCTKPKGHTFENPVDGYTVYYGRDRARSRVIMRDRGTKDVAGTIGTTLEEVWPSEGSSWTEFTYVFTDGKWWVGDPDEGTQTLIELAGLVLGRH